MTKIVNLQNQFCYLLIDKTAYNNAFIFKNFYTYFHLTNQDDKTYKSICEHREKNFIFSHKEDLLRQLIMMLSSVKIYVPAFIYHTRMITAMKKTKDYVMKEKKNS